MKNLIIAIIAFVLLISVNPLFSQDITQQLEEDLSTYTQNFSAPFTKAFVWGLQTGWYNTARPHETLGFDLTITGRFVRVPDTDFLFDFINSEYNTMSSLAGELPTIVGPETSEQILLQLEDENTGTPFSTSFEAPSGVQSSLIGEKYVPLPMVQLGLGIYKGTDMMVRWTPNVTFENLSAQFFGIGVRHNWGQWVPGLKDAPIDLSILVAYSNFKSEVDPEADDIGGEGQAITFDSQGWTFQALVSKEISVLTFYGGIGYNTASTDLKLKGSYIFSEGTSSLEVTDPVNETIKTSGANLTLGLRLKLAIFTLHGDYNIQEYNSWTAGIGFSWR